MVNLVVDWLLFKPSLPPLHKKIVLFHLWLRLSSVFALVTEMCLCHLHEKKLPPRGCWPFSPSPIGSERYGPDLSWLDLQSCLAKPDLDLLTPNWPSGAQAVNAIGYMPCDFIVACYSAIADQYQYLQEQFCFFLELNAWAASSIYEHEPIYSDPWTSSVLKFRHIHCSFSSLSLAFRNWLSWQTTLNST